MYFCILFFIFRVYEVRTNSLFWRPVSVSDDVGGDLRKKPQIFSPSLSLPSFSYNIDIFIICQLKVIRGWIQVKKHFTNSVCSLINIKLQKQKFLTHEQRFHCRAVREQGFCPLMLFIHNLDQWTLVPTSWLKRLSSSSPSPLWSAHLVVWRRGGDLSYASPRSGGKWGHHPSGAVPTVRLDHRRHIFNLYQRQGCKLNLYMQIRCQTLISSFY